MVKKFFLAFLPFLLACSLSKEERRDRGIEAARKGDWNRAIPDLEEYMKHIESDLNEGLKKCGLDIIVHDMRAVIKDAVKCDNVEELKEEIFDYLITVRYLGASYLGKGGLSWIKIAEATHKITGRTSPEEATDPFAIASETIFGETTTFVFDALSYWFFKAVRILERVLYGEEGYTDSATQLSPINKLDELEENYMSKDPKRREEAKPGSVWWNFENYVADLEGILGLGLTGRAVITGLRLGISEFLERQRELEKLEEEGAEIQQLPSACCIYPNSPPYSAGISSPYTVVDIIYDLAGAFNVILNSLNVKEEFKLTETISELRASMDNLQRNMCTKIFCEPKRSVKCTGKDIKCADKEGICFKISMNLKKIAEESIEKVLGAKLKLSGYFQVRFGRVGSKESLWLCIKQLASIDDIFCKNIEPDVKFPQDWEIIGCDCQGDRLKCERPSNPSNIIIAVCREAADMVTEGVVSSVLEMFSVEELPLLISDGMSEVINLFEMALGDPQQCGVSAE